MQVPDGWEVKPLKSIGTCKNGLTYSPDDIVENGGVLVLRSSNIQNSQIALEDNVFVREDIKINYKVQENDILVCVRNGSKDLIGKNALITKEVENMAHGAFMTVFHSKINQYVFQLFQSDLFFKQVEKNLGATINSINNSDLLLFEFPFPKEKKEQEKIAKILSTLDKVIETTNRLIEKEKNIKKALMQELLTNGIDKDGHIRTKATHTYKESELGLIPDEWEVDFIENHAKIITGDKDTQDRLDDGIYPFYVRSQTVERINTYSFDGEAVLTAGDGV
ncbi:MAG: type restriction enzyme subunit, partial [Campylobacterota bacterium]|nr:type restriction enzyme subunit [Campylobacterota bacterium]